jgi:hypothetical protein
MSGFATMTGQQQATQPDPTKHVNYVLGMVLGVDDFTHEFAYLAGRDQWLARALLGYGTVCGLRVSIEPDARGPRVDVSCGTALTPRGQLVHVPSAQCASLNDWLAVAKNQEEMLAWLGSPAGNEISLFVVLCYRECPTDMIPIPGEPCRSEDDSMAPSRLQDDFRLELRFTAPEQREEDALRDFVKWLRRFEISEDTNDHATLDEFLAAVRAAAQFVGSEPQSPPDFAFSSPPAGLRIPAARACAYLRAALRVWVTELRPLWLGMGQTCRTPPDEECLLLAQLRVPVVQVLPSGEWRVDDSALTIDEERRPYLLPLRFLQEWLFCGRVAAEAGDGQSPALVPGNTVVSETAFAQAANAGASLDYSRADHTHGTPSLPPLPTPPAPGTTVVAETTAGRPSAAGVSIDYSRADHTHGTPPLPSIPTPAGTVVAETAFGRAANAGSSPQYSRADHTHGTPPAQAVSGNFVEHPKAAGPFAIVAAGVVSERAPRTPVYNDLKVVRLNDGEVFVHFADYRPPKTADEFQYIIKALPVFNRELRPLIVNFDRYEPDAFVLRVTSIQGEVLKAGQLALIELMIEVSQYPFKE